MFNVLFCVGLRRYHVQNDELLGSWLFFFACVPFVPYSLIYLAAGGYRSLLYLGALGLAIVVCIACFLFVLACYPSDVTVSCWCQSCLFGLISF